MKTKQPVSPFFWPKAEARRQEKQAARRVPTSPSKPKIQMSTTPNVPALSIEDARERINGALARWKATSDSTPTTLVIAGDYRLAMAAGEVALAYEALVMAVHVDVQDAFEAWKESTTFGELYEKAGQLRSALERMERTVPTFKAESAGWKKLMNTLRPDAQK